MLREDPRGCRSRSPWAVGQADRRPCLQAWSQGKGLSLYRACSWGEIICCLLSNYRTYHTLAFFRYYEATEMLNKSLNSFLSTSPMPYLREEMWNCGCNPLSPGVHSYEMKWCYASPWPLRGCEGSTGSQADKKPSALTAITENLH